MFLGSGCVLGFHLPCRTLSLPLSCRIMMTPARVRELINHRPFRPFRLCLSDGSQHEVPHPEFAWVYGGRVFVGTPGKDSLHEDGPLKELSILHVTRVEELSSPKARK